MSKTLADMTPEERAECVGMWASVVTERFPAVIVRICISKGFKFAQMLAPEINDYYPSGLGSITPRFDLPRAWTPNGQPVDMDVESETVQPHPRGGIIGPMSHPFYTDIAPGTRVRRFVTDWEQVEVDE